MKLLHVSLAAVMLCMTATFSQAQSPTATDRVERPKIYDPTADAESVLNRAISEAKMGGKHVFVQVGGNWCGWCIKFHDLVEATPQLNEYLHKEFVPVLVNYSQENKNEKIMTRLGHPGRFGFPVFVILNGDGKVIHIQNTAYLEEGKGHSVKEVMNFLKAWTYEAVNPTKQAQ